jgi:hypothetical protein
LRILFNHNISGTADLIDLMRRARPDLYVIATHERRDTPIALAANRLLPEPFEARLMSPDAYANWLLQIALAEGAELVVPYRRRDELAEFQGMFKAQGVRLLTVADSHTIRLIEDKPSLLARMQLAEIPTTPFRLFEGAEGYARLRAEGRLFPDHPGLLCVKPAAGIYGAGFRILHDELPPDTPLSGLSTLDLSDVAFRALLATVSQPEPMMLMPFLEGPERSVDFSCYEGHLLGTVTRVKAKTSQMLFHDSYGEELAGLIAQTFKLTGVLNLQTIEDASGTQRLMEVNTRASGGIGMTGLTNVNLPALLLNALDGPVPDCPARVIGEVCAGRRELFWGV